MNPSAFTLARSIDAGAGPAKPPPARATDAMAEKLARLHEKADRLTLSLGDSASSLLGPFYAQQGTRVGEDAGPKEVTGALGSLDAMLDALGTKLDDALRHAERLSSI